VQAHLTDAIDDFLASTALWTTEWFNKSKFHMILHLPDHVRRFGLAILFATEGFESYNAVIRLRSVHSSRSAPSKDIAESFSHLHAVRHLVCGGAFYVSGIAEPCFPGVHIRSLLENKGLAAVLGRGELTEEENGHAGYGSVLKNAPCMPWQVTASSRAVHRPASIGPSNLLAQAIHATLPSEERVYVHDMVVFQTTHLPQFGRVEEILVDHHSWQVQGVLVHPFKPGELALPYRFHQAEQDQHARAVFISLQVCLFDAISRICPHRYSQCIQCPVHTIHNCALSDCKPLPTRIIRQERVSTGKMDCEIAHGANPDNIVFNLAQMGHAQLIRPLLGEVRYPGLSREVLIERAVARRRQLEAEKKQKAADKQTAAEEKQKKAAERKKKKEARDQNPRVRRAKVVAQPSPSVPATVDDLDMTPRQSEAGPSRTVRPRPRKRNVATEQPPPHESVS
jgi:hypothetical protein